MSERVVPMIASALQTKLTVFPLLSHEQFDPFVKLQLFSLRPCNCFVTCLLLWFLWIQSFPLLFPSFVCLASWVSVFLQLPAPPVFMLTAPQQPVVLMSLPDLLFLCGFMISPQLHSLALNHLHFYFRSFLLHQSVLVWSVMYLWLSFHQSSSKTSGFPVWAPSKLTFIPLRLMDLVYVWHLDLQSSFNLLWSWLIADCCHWALLDTVPALTGWDAGNSFWSITGLESPQWTHTDTFSCT